MNEPTKYAILEIDAEILRKLLCLPPEAIVEEVWRHDDRPFMFQIRVRGVGYEITPNRLGSQVPRYGAQCQPAAYVTWPALPR